MRHQSSVDSPGGTDEHRDIPHDQTPTEVPRPVHREQQSTDVTHGPWRETGLGFPVFEMLHLGRGCII